MHLFALSRADAEIALLHREVERLEGQITPLMVIPAWQEKVVNLMDDAATRHRSCVASIQELKGKEAISATKVLKMQENYSAAFQTMASDFAALRKRIGACQHAWARVEDGFEDKLAALERKLRSERLKKPK